MMHMAVREIELNFLEKSDIIIYPHICVLAYNCVLLNI